MGAGAKQHQLGATYACPPGLAQWGARTILGPGGSVSSCWERGIGGVAAERAGFFWGCMNGSVASLAEEGLLTLLVTLEPGR